MFLSRAHQQIVVPFRDDVMALFPHAMVLQWEGKNMIAVPHGTEETRLLRNLEIDAPAPIAEYYSWPGFRQPFLVQVKTCSMMTTSPRCYVLNRMGTGKTKSALWSFDFLKQRGEAKKMLVVAPLSTLDFVWRREVMETVPHLRVAVLHGSAAKRKERLAEDADIYVINHDGVEVVMQDLLKRTDIDCICIDELAAFRNARAVRSKVMRAVVQSKRWVWGMTGSPTPTSPTDAFGLAKLITPEKAPRSFLQFRYDTMLQVSQFKWVARADAATVVANTLQPSVCYQLDDVVELPELIERPIDVPQGPRQRRAYDDLVKYSLVDLKEGRVTAQNGGILFTKLLQTSCGYVYSDRGPYVILDNDLRLEAMRDIIENAEQKIIVFAPFIHATEQIASYLKGNKIEHRVVTGQTPKGERDEIFNSFQRKQEFNVLVAHPGCMAHGLTLTAADTICWFSPITSNEIFEQANARITRVGQTHKQQVFMLQGTPVERTAYRRLRERQSMQDDIINLLAEVLEP